jgi:hypothetical protein
LDLKCSSFFFKAQKKLKDVQGLIVEYPLYFLDDEAYLPSIRTREGQLNFNSFFFLQKFSYSFLGLVPSVMWT